MDLKDEHLTEALRRIAAWRVDPEAPQLCPACGAPGVGIVDRSVRPYAEWYTLTCTACGLDTALHIPLPGPIAG